jgi:hypothetical protein
MNRAFVCSLLIVGSLAAAGPAGASSSGGHCPPSQSGFIPWDVATEPYQADNRVDEQGNNNGMACALPLKTVVLDDGTVFQLYNFIDDAGTIPG